MNDPTFRGRPLRQIIPTFLVLLFGLAFVLTISYLLLKSGPRSIANAADWFDPVFFQYNLFLLGFSVLLIPAVTYFYVKQMAGEKLKRLHNEFPPAQWQASEASIRDSLKRQFSINAFFGSMTILMLVVTFGASIILLLKPVPGCESVAAGAQTALACGVDYSRGANLLLLGPFIELYSSQDGAFFHHVVISLTAFQFGFLGAYVYFIGRLARDYFTLDLTSHTYIASTIRIATASLLALVVSFAFGHLLHDNESAMAFLPVLSFFFGYFPEQALDWLRKRSMQIVKLSGESYRETPLSALPGINYYHCARLVREGYENTENLASAHPEDLALRTGFNYSQLRKWIGQAWLMAHLGAEDYRAFAGATGITDPDEMLEFRNLQDGGERSEWFADALGPELQRKVRNVDILLTGWHTRLEASARGVV